MGFFQKLSDIIANVTSKLSCVFLAIAACTLLVQVILRFVFNSGIMFADELAKYSTIWAVMLISNVLIKDNALITVDFFDHLWPESFIKWRNTAYQIIVLVLLFFLVKEGWEQAIKANNHRLASINISWFYPYLAIPVGAFLMMYQYIFGMVKMWKRSN